MYDILIYLSCAQSRLHFEEAKCVAQMNEYFFLTI